MDEQYINEQMAKAGHFFDQGLELQNKETYRQSIEFYSKAIEISYELKNNGVNTRNNMGLLFMCHYNRGYSYARIEEYNKAYNDWIEANKIMPSDESTIKNLHVLNNTVPPDVLYNEKKKTNLDEFNIFSGQYEEYNQLLKDALRRNDNSSMYDIYNKLLDICNDEETKNISLINFSDCLLKKDKFDEVISLLGLFIESYSKDDFNPEILAGAYVNYGVAYEYKGCFEEAVYNYSAALKIDKNNTLAKKYLNELKFYGDMDKGLLRKVKKDDGKWYIDLWIYQSKYEEKSYTIKTDFLLNAAIISNKKKVPTGNLVEVVGPAYLAIINELEMDNEFLFKFSKYSRKFEELIASAYKKAGWDEVILTPGTRDGGKDIIATKKDINGDISIKIYDEVKAYSKNRPVTADIVRGLYGTMCHDHNVSKCIITTSSYFAPGIYDEFKDKIPDKIELRDGIQLKKWLIDMYRKQIIDFDINKSNFYKEFKRNNN